MTQLFANNAVSKLDVGIDASTTSIVLVDGSKFPSPSGGDYFYVTVARINANGVEDQWEVMKCTGRTANTLTVVRGQDGTTGVSAIAGSPVELRLVADVSNNPDINSLRVKTSITHDGLTASSIVMTDASKNLVSATATGTGNVVLASSPTLSSPNLGTPTTLVGTNITGTAAGLTAGNVTTNANLTGDVTSVGNATTIGANKVTLGHMAQVATSSLLGRSTAGTGNVEVLDAATTKTLLSLNNVDNTSDASKPISSATSTALSGKQDTSGKDASGGYVGLTLLKINFRNALNTFTSFFTNSNTAARTYTFPDKDGTVAMISDITGTNSGTNTGDNAVNTTYANDYRAANFVAGTNYVAPGGALGTPSSGNLANCTFPATISSRVTGFANAGSPRLYSTDASYNYDTGSPYYGYLTYTGTRWRFQVSPSTPAAVEVAYADTAGSANSVAWTNVSGRPTAVSSFTNDSGYITSSGSISGNSATTSQRTFSNVRTDGINRGSYGSISISGTNSTYAGIDFTSIAYTWMSSVSSGVSFGVYKNDTTWAFYFDQNGSLVSGSVPWGNVTGKPTTVSSFSNDSGYITSGGRAYPRRSDGGDLNFYWSGQAGQPTWLWGGGDGTNMYVYNPSNFSVNYATTAGSAPANGGTSSYVTINYNNDSNSTYQMLWGSGNGVYGTAGIYCNPATDQLVASSFYANGTIYATGNVIAYYSDARLKNEVGKVTNALDKVKKLTAIYYTANDLAKSLGIKDDGRVQIGLRTQDVESVLPEIIFSAPFDMDEEGKSKSGEDYKTMQYDRLVPLLVEAIKELNDKVTAMENKYGKL